MGIFQIQIFYILHDQKEVIEKTEEAWQAKEKERETEIKEKAEKILSVTHSFENFHLLRSEP